MRQTRRVAAVALLALAVIALGWGPVSRSWRATHLLLTLSGGQKTGSAKPVGEALYESEVEVPHKLGTTRARIYRLATGEQSQGIVVAHGVHYQGIDERRLVPFARALARAGLVVLTPELRDIADYRITDRGVAEITGAVTALSKRTDLVSSRRVGVLGFSFAGGLSLVAAAQPELRDKLSYVASVGGHHDLARVLRFFLTHRIDTPSGIEERKAHDYGLVVLVYGHVDRFVPKEDQETLRRALRAWLQEKRPKAREAAAGCSTPACTKLFKLVETGRLAELADRITAEMKARSAYLDALSPRGKLHRIRVPVYLLHGPGDSVIPPSELRWAAKELERQDHVALVSPLMDHVEVSKEAGLGDKLALMRFMAGIL